MFKRGDIITVNGERAIIVGEAMPKCDNNIGVPKKNYWILQNNEKFIVYKATNDWKFIYSGYFELL